MENRDWGNSGRRLSVPFESWELSGKGKTHPKWRVRFLKKTGQPPPPPPPKQQLHGVFLPMSKSPLVG